MMVEPEKESIVELFVRMREDCQDRLDREVMAIAEEEGISW